ncbi:MAG: hypothetical protein J5I94_26495 [Phaeodactylibacter sp.]|nr:hypothetical protein [Phaeodactylibacter sp.]
MPRLTAVLGLFHQQVVEVWQVVERHAAVQDEVGEDDPQELSPGFGKAEFLDAQ